MSRTAAIALCLAVASCGFKLQGAVTMPPEMERTYVSASDRFTPFYRELVRELSRAGAEVVDSPARATSTFAIYSDDTGQRVLSVSARNVPTEYEVYYTIRYGVTSGGSDVLVETRDVTRTQAYLYDTTIVLGKAQEEDRIRAALVDDLVRFIMRQLSTQ